MPIRRRSSVISVSRHCRMTRRSSWAIRVSGTERQGLFDMPDSALRIGTRGSPMAIAQTERVRDLLAKHHPDLQAPGATEIVVIRTTGDAIQDRRLAEVGGKQLFTK